MRKVFPQGEWVTGDKGLHLRKVYTGPQGVMVYRYTVEKDVYMR